MSSCSVKTSVQTLLLPRPHWNARSAASWARSHGFRAFKVECGERYCRVRQRAPSMFCRGTFRTIPFGKSGVKAVIGKRKG